MDLSNCLELYIRYLKYEKNLSLNSINSYQKDILQFLYFLKGKNINQTGLLSESTLPLLTSLDFLKEMTILIFS